MEAEGWAGAWSKVARPCAEHPANLRHPGGRVFAHQTSVAQRMESGVRDLVKKERNWAAKLKAVR